FNSGINNAVLSNLIDAASAICKSAPIHISNHHSQSFSFFLSHSHSFSLFLSFSLSLSFSLFLSLYLQVPVHIYRITFVTRNQKKSRRAISHCSLDVNQPINYCIKLIRLSKI